VRDEPVGCPDLLAALRRLRPRLHVFGHIHEGYGVTTEGPTTCVNASSCTVDYEPINPPITIDL
jgi:Icc-related predicted phosphoesterase